MLTIHYLIQSITLYTANNKSSEPQIVRMSEPKESMKIFFTTSVCISKTLPQKRQKNTIPLCDPTALQHHAWDTEPLHLSSPLLNGSFLNMVSVTDASRETCCTSPFKLSGHCLLRLCYQSGVLLWDTAVLQQFSFKWHNDGHSRLLFLTHDDGWALHWAKSLQLQRHHLHRSEFSVHTQPVEWSVSACAQVAFWFLFRISKELLLLFQNWSYNRALVDKNNTTRLIRSKRHDACRKHSMWRKIVASSLWTRCWCFLLQEQLRCCVKSTSTHTEHAWRTFFICQLVWRLVTFT